MSRYFFVTLLGLTVALLTGCGSREPKQPYDFIDWFQIANQRLGHCYIIEKGEAQSESKVCYFRDNTEDFRVILDSLSPVKHYKSSEFINWTYLVTFGKGVDIYVDVSGETTKFKMFDYIYEAESGDAFVSALDWSNRQKKFHSSPDIWY